MALKFNNNNITSVKYNGINLKTVKYNGTLVFQSPVSSPTIGAITTTYNSASFSVTNTSLYSVNLKVTVNGYTQTKAAGAAGTATQTQNFSFNNASHGLTSDTTYSVVAYAEFGAMLSGNANSSFKTLVKYTSVPIIVSVSQTWNTINWRLKNDDNATSIIKTRLYDSSQNSPIGDELTISLAPGGEYTFSKSGLYYSTDYYIKRTALANDGKLEPTYETTGPYRTAEQPTTPSPSVSTISKTSYSVTIRVISGSPNDSATLFYSVVSNNGSPTGYTQHGTTLQGYNADSNGIDITLSTLYIGGSFSPNTNYDVYVKAQISGWKESSSIKYDIATNPVLTAPVITITDVVHNGFKWYSTNQSNVATVQISSNVNSSTSWPSEYFSSSVAPSANTQIFPTSGRYTAAAGGSYTVYAKAVDPTGAYESSTPGSAAVPVTGSPGFTNLSGSTTNTLYFRITNSNAYSVSYTWHNSDWSRYNENISLGANTYVDIPIGSLSSSTTHTFYCYFTSTGRISSASVSASGTTSTPITYYEVKWYDFEGGYIPNSARTYAAGSTCESAHYPSNPQVPNCRTWNGWNKAAGFAVNQNWSISPNTPNNTTPGSCGTLSVNVTNIPGVAILTWSQSASCATGYWISYTNGNTTSDSATWYGAKEVPRTGGSFSFANGGNYTFRVRATNNGTLSPTFSYRYATVQSST